MPEIPEMLEELYDLVQDEEINNLNCDHESPSDVEQFCCVCFIINLYQNVSLEEPAFTEETTETQRETIEKLWEEFCDQDLDDLAD